MMRLIAAAMTLVSLTLLVAPALPEERSPEETRREELVAAAREIMISSRYCALVTLGEEGRPQVRAMDPFPPDAKMVVKLGTNAHSSKVSEIRNEPRVTLYYFDREAEAYVSLEGTARLLEGATEKARYWKEEWAKFYPDREHGYLVIEVIPERLEIVSEKHGIFGGSVTWAPPVVEFPAERHERPE